MKQVRISSGLDRLSKLLRSNIKNNADKSTVSFLLVALAGIFDDLRAAYALETGKEHQSSLHQDHGLQVDRITLTASSANAQADILVAMEELKKMDPEIQQLVESSVDVTVNENVSAGEDDASMSPSSDLAGQLLALDNESGSAAAGAEVNTVATEPTPAAEAHGGVSTAAVLVLAGIGIVGIAVALSRHDGNDHVDHDPSVITGTENADNLLYGGSSLNLKVGALGGDDTVLTGKGNDTINTGQGDDIVRAGEGADSVTTGDGDDVVVIVGQTGAHQYDLSDITNPGGSGIDLSGVLTLDTLNGRAVSEAVAGESIDGGAGSNTLFIYGIVNLGDVNLSNISAIQVNSSLVISASQLNDLSLDSLAGTDESALRIVNDAGSPVVVDLSGMIFTGFTSLVIDQDVTVIVDQTGVDALSFIGGSGTLQASDATGSLSLDGIYYSVSVVDKFGFDDAADCGGNAVDGSVLVGYETSDTLDGSSLADRIDGKGGDDVLHGNEGNDVLRGGAGIDEMYGGDGDDHFVIVGDLSAGGKVDSVEDTAALGFPLTDLNGVDLNEDENGAAEIIDGGDGYDTLHVYGTADLSAYTITGIEDIQIRSDVTFGEQFFQDLIATGGVTLSGDGSSILRIAGGTPEDPLVLTMDDSFDLSGIGEISLGPNVVLKIENLDQLGGARVLSGSGTIEGISGAIDLPDSYSVVDSLTVLNADGSDASGSATVHDVSHAMPGVPLISGDGDDYLIGTSYDDILDGGNGVDILSGKDGDDIFVISGTGQKTIIDSGGRDMIDFSSATSGVNISLSDGGHTDDVEVLLGYGSVATAKQPLDLFITEDLSGSFGDDVATVRALLDNLISEIQDMQPNSAFGAGSFVDKPKSPFGDYYYGDYVYKTWSAIDTDPNLVKASFDSMVVLNGYDWPEAQLEALYQVALRAIQDDNTSGDNEIGFRPGAVRVVVIATDANYHQEGDNPVAPNNGDTVLDGTPPGTGEDYPSVAQVKAALIDANIFPVFTVTGANISTYQNLVSDFDDRGAVVSLSSNSSDIVNAIKTGLEHYKVDFIEDIKGTAFHDIIDGNSLGNTIDALGGDDIVTGLAGNDTIDGGDGSDIAVYRGNFADYTINNLGYQVEIIDSNLSRDGSDILKNFETLRFADGDVSLSAPDPDEGIAHVDFVLPFEKLLSGEVIDYTYEGFVKTITFDDISGNLSVLDWSGSVLGQNGSVYANVDYSLDGYVKFGVPITIEISLGEAALGYSMNTALEYPEQISAGETFTVKSFAPTLLGDPTMVLDGPQATLDVKAVFEYDIDAYMSMPYGWNFDLTGDLLDSKVDDEFVLVDYSTDGVKSYEMSLLSLPDYDESWLLNTGGKISHKPLGGQYIYHNPYVELTLNPGAMSDFDASGDVKPQDLNGDTIMDISGSVTTTDPVLDLTFDVDDIIGKLVGFGNPVAGEAISRLDEYFRSIKEIDVPLLGKIDLSTKIDYGAFSLDAVLGLSPSFKVEYIPDSTVAVTLHSSWGETHSGVLGDDFSFTVPDDFTGETNIWAEFDLSGDLGVAPGIVADFDLNTKTIFVEGEVLGKELPHAVGEDGWSLTEHTYFDEPEAAIYTPTLVDIPVDMVLPEDAEYGIDLMLV